MVSRILQGKNILVRIQKLKPWPCPPPRPPTSLPAPLPSGRAARALGRAAGQPLRRALALALADSMNAERISSAISRGREAFAGVVDSILATDDAGQKIHLGTEALSLLSNSTTNPTPSTHGDAEFRLRSALFEVLIEREEFEQAASTLGGMNMSNVTLGAAERADAFVKVAETYLAVDEAVDAEVFVNKASALVDGMADRSLQLRYRTTLARVLDSNRKFLEAAMRYYELSKVADGVDPEDLLALLSRAVACACLGRAGPQRTRVLTMLFRDARLGDLDCVEGCGGHAAVLSKMYRGQLLREGETASFEASLQEHQRATGADGLAILERAVIEHNMEAAGRIYDCIKVEELATLLGVAPETAERFAARMISEGRLGATIDQVDGFLNFEATAAQQEGLHAWDGHIAALCKGVNACVELVQGATQAAPK